MSIKKVSLTWERYLTRQCTAFHAIGHVAMHVKGGMAPYLDAILINIKEGLHARG